MGRARATLGLVAVVAAGVLVVSGGSEADPQTPRGLSGTPPPFLGTAVVGSGGLTAAIDAYGDVVDLRAPGPAGRALIDNPLERQVAGTVPRDTGIQPWVRAGGRALPMWRADRVRQRYLAGTNVLRTAARFGRVRFEILQAARGGTLAMLVDEGGAALRFRVNAALGCEQQRRGGQLAMICEEGGNRSGGVLTRARRTIDLAAVSDRRWLQRSRPLGPSAPAWAGGMYRRALLVLHAVTDRQTGAVAAGARDGWAYVWPRDAATGAIAFAAAGYQAEAERSTRFLLGLGLEEAARFRGDGSPVPGRRAQGDAIGWVAAAARAAGLTGSAEHAARILSKDYPTSWRDRSDYQEGEAGDFLADAIASDVPGKRIANEFGGPDGLVRIAGGDGGLDSAAAWAVRPFPQPALYGPVRRTLLQLAGEAGAYGLLPSEGWTGGEEPWSAPTAWTAWSLAALGERRQALLLIDALRRSSTPAGAIPERVDARTGIPRSTTPLAWSHAFAILALQELWPARTGMGG